MMNALTRKMVTMMDFTKAAKIYRAQKDFKVAIPVNLDAISKTNLILGSRTIQRLNTDLYTNIRRTCKRLSKNYPSMLVWVSNDNIGMIRSTLDSEAMSTYYFNICVSTDKVLSEETMKRLINEIRVHIMANASSVIEQAFKKLNRECDKDSIYDTLYSSMLDYATTQSDIIEPTKENHRA